MPQQILLIEDDNRLAEMVRDYLGASGFKVTIAADGQKGLDQQRRQQFDAILLDIMLPDIDGLEVCRKLRANDRTPILMLTAKGEPMDRIIGLELGADDYLPKPFEPRELLARLKAVLRRGRSETDTRILRFGRLEIDSFAMEARVDGHVCNLTAHQFQLLEVLASRAGRVLSRDTIMNALKGENLAAFDRSIDVHVSRIRAEIEDDPNKPRRLITVRGAGYVFARSQE
ncbi:DNA-binding response OmpR family regulator [Labrenzia sp. EL_208]|uniref:response regulator n=1 Tax=Roseibium album TaxID=311410 RepID=UPI000D556791|nr:response regulator transcription factor [Roseibium album]MBG6154293.1 DNA-binding response OmpR family regulator [Labrenzia sp. EL_162]MBG6175162.1 DNA-binding response OmpR family regulator [Labrenzia sp. EL_132]MBG6193578.1 DNA-binding response OmpR family regulator [Labrenzia sp. EL_159]MBG6199948.1 DNA-binding response OmpR family regulator [Labrenzia sp. EL_13]MBG6229774.1 DNA-binding response OmpR family regulator [Labrenzia sp. EL_208]